jgi:hypothetical protein
MEKSREKERFYFERRSIGFSEVSLALASDRSRVKLKVLEW